MHKCPKCGTEFEGKFCPECGEKFAEEKTCPKCGATLSGSAKFCNECGYSFYEKPAPKPAPVAPQPVKKEKQLTAGITKLYAAVSVLPAVLFGAFTVLMFLLFLAPVAVMPEIDLLGQKIPSASYGSVYDFSNYEGMPFTGCMTALIVLAAFALFLTFLILLSFVFSGMRDKRYTIAGKKVFLRSILTTIGYALFFALFLTACIMPGQIAGADGGLGVMQVGTAPTLVLVFTLICLLVSVLCVIVGVYLRKAYPALVAATEERVAKGKPTKVEVWINKHKAWVAVISSVLIVAIIVAIAVPIGLANRHNGIYYVYNGETEEYDMTRYYELKGDTWKDQNERKGKISFDGENVTITYDPSNGMDKTGSSVTTKEGTIVGDVLKVGGTVYAKEGHEHRFGDWEVEKNSTCVEVGTKKRVCICGKTEWRETALAEHTLENVTVEATCTDAGWAGTRCKVCGKENGSYREDALHIKYTLSDDRKSYCVSSLSSECQHDTIVIPQTYKGLTVTSIGSNAFDGCEGLKSIVISDSVTSIGGSAFDGTAYYHDETKWDESGVLYIGNHLIEAKTTISGTYVIREGTKTIANNAFYNCSGLTSIEIPDSVTSIGSYAFSGCSGLKSVTIPDGVTEIGEYAFSGCSGLTSVTFGSGVTSIGGDAFYNCSGLTGVNITDLAAWCKIDFGSSRANPLDYAHHLYLDDVEVKDLTIPSEIKWIKDYAFIDCNGLTSITIPNSVTTIGGDAFSGCSGLKSVTIPDSVTSIGSSAFEDCSSLTSITIPDSVTSIGSDAFRNCSGLESVTIGNGVTEIGDYAFSDCSGLTSIKIPDGVTEIGDYAFSDCSGLTSVTIPDSVTEIGGYAFSGCSGLTSITIPDSVTSTGRYAFSGCSGLTSIYIPDSVTTIGVGAFSNCSRLNDIQFKGTVAEWQAIEKGRDWNNRIGNYTVTCTDGTVKKDGTVTYFGE